MSQQPNVHLDRRFIETCLELHLLDHADAKFLSEEIGDSDRFIGQSAVQRGLLTPADVDIVQSLLHPQSIVPGYKILDMIGRGGMGVVYRAQQVDLEKIVALKTILISNVHDPTVAARFEREAKSLAKLQHPNIVQALNFGKHEGRYYFAMEYVPGRTCEQAISEEGFMPPASAWSIVRQVASGLMHALGHNVIHRDIKPANIMMLPPPEGSVNRAEIVKIADFGLAIFADQSSDQLKLTTGDKIMGSPAYMSLEQFGGRHVDFRSDIYSLGATAWHLLFGKPPFQGRNVAALFQQKSEPFVVDPSALPIELPDDHFRLLVRLLDPDPNGRPQNYDELIDAIDALSQVVSAAPKKPHVAVEQRKSTHVSIAGQSTKVRLFVSSERITPAAELEPIDAMKETIELSEAPARTRFRRSRWLVLIGMLAVAVLVIGRVPARFPSRGPRTYTRVVGSTPLFDGVTLSGWDVGGSMVGAWNTVEAPDSSTAIACTTRQGALTRRIPDTLHPRISLFVWLQKDGGPVDIDFAIDPTDPIDIRGCLRLTGDANQLGEKKSDFDLVDVAAQSVALSTIYERYHAVHIERQPTDWYVFLEEKLVGTLPIDRVGDGNAIRLVVHPGKASGEQSKAFFADVQLNQLAEKTPVSSD
jgi:serine/threonine protein kinase